jgi:hypothetical protein
VYFLLHGDLYATLRRDEPAGGASAAPEPAPRPVSVDDEISDSVNVMTSGPLPAERDAGLTTEVPDGVRAIGSRRHEGNDRHLDLFLLADPAGMSDRAVAQIVCTAIAASTSVDDPVERVSLWTRRREERGPYTCPVRA